MRVLVAVKFGVIVEADSVLAAQEQVDAWAQAEVAALHDGNARAADADEAAVIYTHAREFKENESGQDALNSLV